MPREGQFRVEGVSWLGGEKARGGLLRATAQREEFSGLG
jgi:hypothetical protein